MSSARVVGMVLAVTMCCIPSVASAQAQADEAGADALVITTRFFGGARYSYDGSEPASIFGWGLTFGDDFEETMSRHPEALAIAKRAYPWNALALLGGVGTLTVSTKLLIDTIRDAQTLDQGQFPDEPFPTSDVVLLLASGAAVLVGNAAAGDRFTEGVRLFNRLEAERLSRASDSPKPPGLRASVRPLFRLSGRDALRPAPAPAAGIVLAFSF